ncbi:MAG: polysaccharide deacetylase family protein [Polyangiaceae bacterium]|jgi:peptidoglycan-N-acetylglucosamine deacetylase
MPPVRLALYVATAALLGLTGFAVVARPPPLVWAGAALLGYVGLVLGGVFVLRWRVFVDAVVSAPRGARGVALTFDDGPHPTWTPRILDLLAERGARATFFLIGQKAEAYPDVVRAIVARGHAVGLHSYAHDRLFALRGERRVRADLEQGIAALEKIIGHRPVMFRPPVGHTNPVIARVADSLDLVPVGWTIAGHDGVARAQAGKVARRIRRDLRDGVIVLLHDAPERGDREPAAVEALPAILDAIFAERLEVVPVSRWIEVSQGAAAGSST